LGASVRLQLANAQQRRRRSRSQSAPQARSSRPAQRDSNPPRSWLRAGRRFVTTRSLRSRLIMGMLLGMALLLIAAGAVVYTIQRRELYRAFDSSLLTTANSVALAIHPSRFGDWF